MIIFNKKKFLKLFCLFILFNYLFHIFDSMPIAIDYTVCVALRLKIFSEKKKLGCYRTARPLLWKKLGMIGNDPTNFYKIFL